ncbi:hypothetical protein PAAG_12698 [Paracoccidioides lutzii Pb01]|uniref:Uncharacterized protein n=1 Tax=Paracoccidioides lutzii (strain ATCC MYA-826 / Pb01) TaxID=502779 RepID=A0A0A2V2R4_PARBA|nr:hypothetical protein PAAG_12698 [Paracoccidioides lutzii Pb01]KGQ00647.1 hypothetical protein PAAG_12698 [Paracoccidioides lutzii Pb01]
MNSSSCESDETSALKSICKFTAASEGTSSPQSQMFTPNTSDMITMSVADIDVEYVISLMKEHLNIMKELTIIHINNDYLTFQKRFCYLVTCHKKLMNNSENFYHDLFLIDLKEHQKSFVKTCLDDFYMTGQDYIKNIDIDDLMKHLTNYINKSNEYFKPS